MGVCLSVKTDMYCMCSFQNSIRKIHRARCTHALITTDIYRLSMKFLDCVTETSHICTFFTPVLFALWPPDNGCHCCVDVVDTSAVRGQRLVPKNTRPLAFLLTVASHGTVLSEPASEQQAGHSIPLFSAYTWACIFRP